MKITSATATGTMYRSITLTIIVTFVLSFAFLYWTQKSREPPVPKAAPSPSPRGETRQLAPQPLPAASAEPAASLAPEPSMPADGSDAPPLPVIFKVTQRTDAADEETPEDTVKTEARLINSSDKGLAVTVIALNLPTRETSQAQVFLGANAEGHAGTDEGLKMQSGDQIILRSAGFTDLKATVP